MSPRMSADDISATNEQRRQASLRAVGRIAAPLSRSDVAAIKAILEEITINRSIGADHRFSDDEIMVIEAALRARLPT